MQRILSPTLGSCLRGNVLQNGACTRLFRVSIQGSLNRAWLGITALKAPRQTTQHLRAIILQICPYWSLLLHVIPSSQNPSNYLRSNCCSFPHTAGIIPAHWHWPIRVDGLNRGHPLRPYPASSLRNGGINI